MADEYAPEIPNHSRRVIFVIGVLSLALVPVFQMVTDLPPFLGVLLGLVVLWFYTDIMYSKLHMHESNKFTYFSVTSEHRPSDDSFSFWVS